MGSLGCSTKERHRGDFPDHSDVKTTMMYIHAINSALGAFAVLWMDFEPPTEVLLCGSA